MEIGDNVTVKVMGKVIKKELYKDGKTRILVENAETNEIALIVEKKLDN